MILIHHADGIKKDEGIAIYSLFVTEPELNAAIYHLSTDEEVALCKRPVAKMICIGSASKENAGENQFEIIAQTTILRRCCLNCVKHLG